MFVKKGDVTTRREGAYPPSCAKRMTAPSAEGAKGPRLRTRGYPQSCAKRMTAPSAEGAFWGRVCGRGGISRLRTRPKGFAIALWKPSPALFL